MSQAPPSSLHHLNRTSVQLYRILLQQCRQVGGSTHYKHQYPNSHVSNEEVPLPPHSTSNHLLLQRPVDPRDYGHAAIRQSLFSSSSSLSLIHDHTDHDTSPTQDVQKLEPRPQTYRRMVAFFQHLLQREAAAASSRSPSRSRSSLSSELRSNSSSMPDEQFVTGHDLLGCVRHVFRQDPLHDDALLRKTYNSEDDEEEEESNDSETELHKSTQKWTKETIVKRHRKAVDAIRILNAQLFLWQTTSVYWNKKRHTRVIATSSCIGSVKATTSQHIHMHMPPAASSSSSSSSPSPLPILATKYRFAYRIRVENTLDPLSFSQSGNGTRAVQLLGRSWKIQEIVDKKDDNDNDDDDVEQEKEGEVMEVHAPTTGAVGHLPVIQPGEMFEYMSGCELSTRTGTMSGCFYMASVDEGKSSSIVGGKVAVAAAADEDEVGEEEELFELEVRPFSLVAS